MATNEDKQPSSPFGELLENMLAPELYAFAASSFSAANGVVTITLVSSRFDNSVRPPVRRQVVVARVSMPLLGALDLATGLYDFLQKNGVTAVNRDEKDRMQ